ncbi:DUF885 domain-containing protein [Paenibacillus xylaniclasticus]|uniref:DUF885 domain-containing protein n=1 Tax=Paenibacillus xylaniclasticus TaxID=588083 RepID=UPI000FDA6A6B|nr:DUF885 domain-containing protein [Paenibacillus xylaniclasticus]
MGLVRLKFRNMKVLALLAIAAVLLAAGGLLWKTSHKADHFEAIMQEIVVATLKDDPETQLYYGVEEAYGVRRDPTKLSDYSDAYYQRVSRETNQIIQKLNEYDTSKLSPEDKLTYDIVKWNLDASQQMYEHWELNMTDYYSLTNFPPYFANNYPIGSQADAENYIAALNGFPDKVAHIIDRIREGQKKGFVPASEFLSEMQTSYKKLRDMRPEETLLYILYEEKLAKLQLDPSEAERLKKELLRTLADRVLASYGSIADVIDNELMEQASVGKGVWSQPGGSEYYSARLKLATSTDLSAQEVHDIARRNVDQLVKEIISQAPDHAQETAAANRLLGGDELLQAFKGSVTTANAYLSHWFEEGLIPDNPVDVRVYSALFASAGGLYIPISIDGDRSGRFIIPLDNPITEGQAKLITMHEGVPGHHLQLAIQYGHSTLPLVRKINSFSGFVEGWAVYVENLSMEEGLLDWSSVQNRLLAVNIATVLDTGIHGLKWTREQANDYLTSVLGASNNALIDAVIAYPGLHTSYAIGYDRFHSLREKAENELQDRFDLKAFHSVLLQDGSMPFPILEQQVNRYIESAR